jgi:hypothetical protein
MNLSEATLPMPYDECKHLALVYHYEVAVALYQVQVEHGDTRHVPVGLQLTDGRWMMRGEVLSEVGPGGLLHGALDHITPEMMANVEVVPFADAAALLPSESPA